MQIRSAHALRALIAGQALRDPAFLKALRENAASAAEARFGAHSYAIRVVFEESDELAVLLPFPTEELTSLAARTAADLRERPPAMKSELEALLAGRAWGDPAFLAHVRADPRGAVNALLEEHGIDMRVPTARQVRLYEEQPGECLVVISRRAEAPLPAPAAANQSAGDEGAPSPTVVAPFRSLTTPSVLTGRKEK